MKCKMIKKEENFKKIITLITDDCCALKLNGRDKFANQVSRLPFFFLSLCCINATKNNKLSSIPLRKMRKEITN
jgi:hypothetical protein